MFGFISLTGPEGKPISGRTFLRIFHQAARKTGYKTFGKTLAQAFAKSLYENTQLALLEKFVRTHKYVSIGTIDPEKNSTTRRYVVYRKEYDTKGNHTKQFIAMPIHIGNYTERLKLSKAVPLRVASVTPIDIHSIGTERKSLGCSLPMALEQTAIAIHRLWSKDLLHQVPTFCNNCGHSI